MPHTDQRHARIPGPLRSLGPPLALVACLVSLAVVQGCAPRAFSTTSRAPAGVSTGSAQIATAAIAAANATSSPNPPTVFAVIGDFGINDKNEREVSRLVASWNPSFIITTGDNYYRTAGQVGTGTNMYDVSVGAYYGAWLKDISTTGKRLPVGRAPVNAFFPSMGNHEYTSTSPEIYTTYFNLPGAGFSNSSGNERYYDYVQGPIHFFVLNSNSKEPDGSDAASLQARWLQRQLSASTSPWNIVYFHHAPYTSDTRHSPKVRMRWPFAEWGADVVISGHDHNYERIMRDGIVYFVNGLGGGTRRPFGDPTEGSAVRYVDAFGAQRVTATDTTLDFEFINTGGVLVDRFHLSAGQPPSQ